MLTWKINKASLTLTAAEELTYSGDAQDLISGDVPKGTKFTLTAPQAGLDYETESAKIMGWVNALADKAYDLSSQADQGGQAGYYFGAASALYDYDNALYYLNDKNESKAAEYISYALDCVRDMAEYMAAYNVEPSPDFEEAIDYINNYVKDTTLEKTKARFDTVEPEWNDTITATNAGTYTVYYKGDGVNYDDTVKSVTATIERVVPAVLIPANLTAEYGQTLADVTISTPDDGTWAWDAPDTSVGNGLGTLPIQA